MDVLQSVKVFLQHGHDLKILVEVQHSKHEQKRQEKHYINNAEGSTRYLNLIVVAFSLVNFFAFPRAGTDGNCTTSNVQNDQQNIE